MAGKIGPASKHDVLRKVGLEGYVLLTWDTNRTDSLGKSVLGYRFSKGEDDVVFEGEDFACAPSESIDSDACLRSILGFLTLRPGDTDAEYFEGYTERQKEFCDSDAEDLHLWTLEESAYEEEGHEPPAFEDLLS